ncbi:MAG: hypothetical protein ACREM2_02825 [Vulcanimicrobiaceae bacterium]
MPRPRVDQWVRLILASGVPYQKQIGMVSETSTRGQLLYYETQVGVPGGSCNPNTMKRIYIQGSSFGSLLSQSRVTAYVAASGTIISRWDDIGGGQQQSALDSRVRLLDLAYLYDDRPLIVRSVEKTTLGLHSGKHAVTHLVADFAPPYDSRHVLRRVELWTTPAVPFGVAKYRALSTDSDPFEATLYSYGDRFKPELAMTLDSIRVITPDGTSVQTG